MNTHIVQIRKLRPRKVQSVPQGYLARKWDLNVDSVAPEYTLYITICSLSS